MPHCWELSKIYSVLGAIPGGLNNARFLILPWVRVPHLASMILALRIPCGLCSSLCTLRLHCSRMPAVSNNRLQRSAGHATLDTGGWLDLMETVLCLPVRDLHPERNDKLRLPH